MSRVRSTSTCKTAARSSSAPSSPSSSINLPPSPAVPLPTSSPTTTKRDALALPCTTRPTGLPSESHYMAIYLTALRSNDDTTLRWLAHCASKEFKFHPGKFTGILTSLKTFFPIPPKPEDQIPSSKLRGASRLALVCHGCERVRFLDEIIQYGQVLLLPQSSSPLLPSTMDMTESRDGIASRAQFSLENSHLSICIDCDACVKRDPRGLIATKLDLLRHTPVPLQLAALGSIPPTNPGA